MLPDYAQLAHDGETFAHVNARVNDFMHDMAVSHPTDNIIVVSHGFTIKAATLVATKSTEPMSIPEPDNTSVTKISFSEETMRYYLWYYNRFDAQTY